jgi:hypothetical protein
MEHRIIKKRNKMKKIFVLILILAIGAASFGFYYYNKPRNGVSGMNPVEIADAKVLFEEYTANEEAANTKYLGKVVEVFGIVKSVETDNRGTMSVTIDSGSEMGAVSCQFEKLDEMPDLKKGSSVLIKGICSGMLLDVVLVDCEIVSKKK